MVNLMLKMYRVSVFITTDSTPLEIERFSTMMEYQNLIWIFLAVITIGLISLICIENKARIQEYIKNF